MARQAHARRADRQPRRPAPRREDRRRPSLPTRLGLLVVCAIAILAIARIAGCNLPGHVSYSESVTTGIDARELYQSPYDWGNLLLDSAGRYSYVSGGQVLSRTGIDVSEHQGYIDWSAVAGDGIDFAIIRLGYRGSDNGAIVQDAYAEYNLKAAREAGLAVGVYFYSQATTEDEAVEEAEFVLDQIGEAQLAYPVVFDFEPTNSGSDRISSLTGTERTAVAEAFCDRLAQAGHAAMIYGNGSALEGFDLEKLASHGFWYAEYGALPDTDLYFSVWQYSNTGRVAGIDTDVDLDLDLTPVSAQSE